MRIKSIIVILAFFSFVSNVNAQSKVISSEFTSYKWNGFCYDIKERTEDDGYGGCIYQFQPTFEMMFNAKNGSCYSESSTVFYLEKIGSIKIENNFVVDGDRYVYMSLRKHSGACLILVLNDKNYSENIVLLRNALHLVYTQYADKNSWPMPTKQLQKKWISKFGNEPTFTNEQCIFLFNEWYTYLKRNIRNVKRWLPKNPQL